MSDNLINFITEVLKVKDDIPLALREHRCAIQPIGCGKVIPDEDIREWSNLTLSEYRISGLCKECQDEIFGSCHSGCGH